MKKNLLALSTNALFIAFCWISGCTSKSEIEKRKTFEVIRPIVVDTSYMQEFVARIHAVQNVEIRTRTKGFIEVILVDEGKQVSKGQTLFSISSTVYQQELRKAKAATKSAMAELSSAEIELENSKKLLEKGIIPETKYNLDKVKVDAGKAKLEEVQSEEERASLNLSFADVRSPFDGMINLIPKKAGSLVEEGDLLTTLSNDKEVFAYFNLSEQEYLNYVTHKKIDHRGYVELILANNSVHPYKGKIETSESEFDPSTGNIAFRARFPNPDRLLKHGSNAKVILRLPLKNAVIVPQKSTFEIQDKIYAFVIKADSSLEQRAITIKQKIQHAYVVESGLMANDVILFEGVEKVSSGMKIISKLKLQSDFNYND